MFWGADMARDSRHCRDMSNFISFETLVRPHKPNTFLMAPDGLCRKAEPDAASPSLAGNPQQVYAELSDMIAAQRSWKPVAQDPEALRLKFIARTPLLGFKDDVDIQVLAPHEGEIGTQIAVYSRSRVGYSDLGANAKRVNSLVGKLTAK